MKISRPDYEALEAACQSVLAANPTVRSTYAAKGLSPMRFRWDVLHASKFDTTPLYKAGLNDNHIDTALRNIVG